MSDSDLKGLAQRASCTETLNSADVDRQFVAGSAAIDGAYPASKPFTLPGQAVRFPGEHAMGCTCHHCTVQVPSLPARVTHDCRWGCRCSAGTERLVRWKQVFLSPECKPVEIGKAIEEITQVMNFEQTLKAESILSRRWGGARE